jgi:SAM-dependent methyltransferase
MSQAILDPSTSVSSADAIVDSSEFSFPAFDVEGLETLEAIAAANRFNRWMYETATRNLSGNVIEIGSGIGNISAFFTQNNRKIHLSDIREIYLEFLRDRFKNKSSVLGISQLDLVHPDFDQRYENLLGSFDGLFALNVVEHIEDDNRAIANGKKLLKSGGRMSILVPANQWLYNQFDRSLEHYRRYNIASLKQLFHQNSLEVARSQYFNLAGMPGWFVSGAILKKKTIPAGQMRLFNALVPLFRIADRCVFNRVGLSVLVEGVKH